jgi:glycerol kinase
MKYVLGIDQSTQGTKALLCDETGRMIACRTLPHEQVINTEGWVSHRPMDLYNHTIDAVRAVLGQTGIDTEDLVCAGISNQRETALLWNRETGLPMADAVVWHCARAAAICQRPQIAAHAEEIRHMTGLRLSAYFTVAKWAWLLENTLGAQDAAKAGKACLGTVDSWLLFKLTGHFVTDVSNAARTQAFNINALQWDPDVCSWFGIPQTVLAKVLPSDAYFGDTDFGGVLPKEIPIRAAMGDSNCSLFGQGCHHQGQVKATYGTGSSIMMNIGGNPLTSRHGLVTSVAWSIGGQVNYVLEGNVNHSGSVITWMKEKAEWIELASETSELAITANPMDETIVVPAFTGLGAPYWSDNAHALITGISLSTGRAELVKAGLESIAYQITDVLSAMQEDTGIPFQELLVDGGATSNDYLMCFQSNLANVPVQVAFVAELSGIGAAYAAGIAAGLWKRETLFTKKISKEYLPTVPEAWRKCRLRRWTEAVKLSMQCESEPIDQF